MRLRLLTPIISKEDFFSSRWQMWLDLQPSVTCRKCYSSSRWQMWLCFLTAIIFKNYLQVTIIIMLQVYNHLQFAGNNPVPPGGPQAPLQRPPVNANAATGAQSLPGQLLPTAGLAAALGGLAANAGQTGNIGSPSATAPNAPRGTRGRDSSNPFAHAFLNAITNEAPGETQLAGFSRPIAMTIAISRTISSSRASSIGALAVVNFIKFGTKAHKWRTHQKISIGLGHWLYFLNTVPWTSTWQWSRAHCWFWLKTDPSRPFRPAAKTHLRPSNSCSPAATCKANHLCCFREVVTFGAVTINRLIGKQLAILKLNLDYATIEVWLQSTM